MAPSKVLDALDTSERGLSAGEAKRRLERHGPNRLRDIARRSLWAILWEQLKSLIMLLLVAAMLVAFFTGQTVEGIAIVAVIVINTAIGFFTEWRAVRSMEALQEMAQVQARVRRNSEEQHISAERLVPGDIVVLEEGEVVPADVRLIEVSELEIDESALTGESVPVAKEVDAVDPKTALADRTSMAYKGTAVTRGSGAAVVVRTGMRTELGEISSMVEAAGEGDTPLEKKLDRLGRKLVWLTLGVAAIVTMAGVLAGRDLYLMIETGIALAVAAIPEGLPIVATVALAAGMWRMLHRNALIRRLSSVETLGATTLICSDKTGTLTENRMTARALALRAGRVEVPKEQDGAFELDGEPTDPGDHEALRQIIEVAVLCNDAQLGHEDDDEQGDPMEIALLDLGRRAGWTKAELEDKMPRVREEAFSRETKMMATFHKTDEGTLVAVKGAPEAVLDRCTCVLGPDGEEEFSDEMRQQWMDENEALAEEGLRILGLARKTAGTEDAEPYEELCFLGHVGLLDPPRTDIYEVIERCQNAGIRVVMVTGDHPATAVNVGKAVGIVHENNSAALRGADFVDPDEASEETRRHILEADVFARVSPEQKLNLIDLHQASGEVVAMTGDGVNDAPALQSADIGVAMGERGTEVAQEAADMVLQDDEFSTIVAAIEQGRVIFENIRKFVIYLLSGNVGEILAVGAAATAGTALPLLPLQILYINILNDVFPALALGLGQGTRRVMDEPPRDPQESVVTRRGWITIGGYGVLIAAAVLGVFFYALWGLGLSETEAVTISFLTLSITRLLHVFNMRRPESGFFNNEITRNPYVWGAIGLCVGLLLVAVYVPFLADILRVTGPSLSHWLLIVVGSLVPLVVGQIYLATQSGRSEQERERPGNRADAGRTDEPGAATDSHPERARGREAQVQAQEKHAQTAGNDPSSSTKNNE
jgi:Ca2+-transporting ATPase